MESKFNCLIVDDERRAAELLSDSIKKLFAEISVGGIHSSWQAALADLRSQSFDLIFMDVSMPEKNGMELLRLVPELDSEIIFVTAHEEHALAAFEFAPVGYLLKPVNDIELSEVVSRAMKRVIYKRSASQIKPASVVQPQLVGIPGMKGVDYINVSEILYLESVHKCTKVVTKNKVYISTNNLGKFKDLIDRYTFFQVHRSFIINLNKIIRFETQGNVIMMDNTKIPVARNSRAEFFKASNVISRYLSASDQDE